MRGFLFVTGMVCSLAAFAGLEEDIGALQTEWARFLKTGSEANSAAIRVARAATGRDVVLYCGYHGWADWYAITTPRSKGIPKDFARFIAPFNYNDVPSLERALDEHYGKVAAVIMEAVLLDARQQASSSS
jgi:glutamate-1-semialdehyde aminotransferase